MSTIYCFWPAPKPPTSNLNGDILDLAELVTSTVEDFQVMAEEKSISVSLDAPAEPMWVRGDKQRLRQVLFILGDNACRYSNPGGHITVALRVDGKEASFSLTDQGIGIPARIWSVFSNVISAARMPAVPETMAPAWACRWPSRS